MKRIAGWFTIKENKEKSMIFKILNLKPSSLFEEIFLRSWWVVLFGLLCLMLYEQGQKHRIVFFEELNVKFLELQRERENAEKLNRELMLHINSQSDPAFVELTLMKILGVISERQVKIYFCDKSPYGKCAFFSDTANPSRKKHS
jgi:hypothetical protein